MTYLPTQTELAELGVRIAHDGFGRHEIALEAVATVARTAGAPVELVDLIVDLAAEPVVRARAFWRLTSDWVEFRRLAAAVHATALDGQIDELLKAWTEHEELKASEAPLADLWDSRANLDQQRLEVAIQRCA